MEITVTGRHVDITSAIRSYAEDKVLAALSEFPRVISIHVILSVEKYRHRAEIVVQASNHIRVDAHDESDDMYVSIDNAVDKADRQLRRQRDKVQDHKKIESLSSLELEAEQSES